MSSNCVTVVDAQKIIDAADFQALRDCRRVIQEIFYEFDDVDLGTVLLGSLLAAYAHGRKRQIIEGGFSEKHSKAVHGVVGGCGDSECRCCAADLRR